MRTIIVEACLYIDGVSRVSKRFPVVLSFANSNCPDLPMLTHGVCNEVGSKMFGSSIHYSIVGNCPNVELKLPDKWVIRAKDEVDITVSFTIVDEGSTAVVGMYKTNEDLHIRLSLTAFTLPMNSVVEIMQVDDRNSKVLLRCGNVMDWYPDSILKKLTKQGE